MNNQKDKLNNLLTKNFDAVVGFKTVAEKLKEGAVKSSFLRKSEERRGFANDIKKELEAHNMTADMGTSFASKLHRVWIDLKVELEVDNEEAMLEEVTRGEAASLKEYEDVLEDTTLPVTIKTMLEKQKDIIKMSLEVTKAMEEMS